MKMTYRRIKVIDLGDRVMIEAYSIPKNGEAIHKDCFYFWRWLFEELHDHADVYKMRNLINTIRYTRSYL